MSKYEVIKDYHPIITKKGGIKEPTDKPVLLKGDIMIQMKEGDTRYKSRDKDYFALYEHTLLQYPDVFKKIK